MVLARVPLEHLYTLCLMFENSEWMNVYPKDGWKKQYERFLLQREETKNLPRYDDYSKKSGPVTVRIYKGSASHGFLSSRWSSSPPDLISRGRHPCYEWLGRDERGSAAKHILFVMTMSGRPAIIGGARK
jgi:hypothetical protein